MILIARLLALASIVYLIKVFLYPLYKPVSNKQKKKARQYIKERKKEQFKQKVAEFKKKIIFTYGKLLMTDVERIKIAKILYRLDIDKKPEEIRLQQILYTVCAIILTIVVSMANNILGYVSAIFIVLAWLMPTDELEKRIETKNKNIALDFPSFYSMIYYQYSKTVNIYLSDVIKDYLPNANKDMTDELGIMLDNIEYGEEYALKQLKKRVPIHYVIKFCDILETRLRGYDNTSQMAYLKNEVDEFRIRALEDELAKREAANGKLQLVLIVILMIYIVIYYLFNTISALKLFQ